MAITIPNTFVAGTKIEATPMNANFAETANAVDKRGDTLTGNLGANAGITVDGIDLSTIPNTSGTFNPLFAQVVIGTADTNGIRLDLESGTLAVREGDDSAYGPLTSGLLTTSGNHVPATNDGGSLGISGTAWADLFLASGGVVNFANGDVTITHSSNVLTFAGAASGYVFNDGNLVVDTNTLYVDATNNRVGIGTTSPSFPLHAMTTGTGTTAAANAVARLASNGTGYDVFCQFSDTVTNSGGIGMLSGNMYIHAGGAERMRIDTNGNVGIGVTPGSVRLDIVGSTDAIRVTQSTTNATSKDGKYLQRHYTNSEEDLLVAYSYSTSTDNGLAFGGGSGAQNAATLIGFYTAANNTTVSGTERLRINSSGHVGIGATARFYLDGVAGTGDTYIYENSSNLIITVVGGTNLFASVNNPTKYNFSYEDFAVDNGKKLFLDGLSNTYFIEGASDRIDVVTGGSTKMEIGAGGGNLYVRFVNGLYMTTWPTTANAANAWVGNGGVLSLSTSSIRYKHDIATLDTTDALSAVMAMRPVTYRGKTDEDQRRFVGFIAEEMQEIAPLLCTYDEGGESGTPNYVTYDRVTAYLVAVVQQQQNEINALKARIH